MAGFLTALKTRKYSFQQVFSPYLTSQHENRIITWKEKGRLEKNDTEVVWEIYLLCFVNNLLLEINLYSWKNLLTIESKMSRIETKRGKEREVKRVSENVNF